jgi:hypothetical protein
MATTEKEQSKGGRPALLILPVLILAGLLTAPPTRTLLQAQLRLLHATMPFLARLHEMGVKSESLPPVPAWKESRTAASVTRFPDDYAVQIGGALLAETYTKDGPAASSQDLYAIFQRRYGERLTAVSTRFPDRPGPYAHLLRFMTRSTVRVSREVEVETFQTGKTPPYPRDHQVGYADSWAAFDQAAAQGEKLDPDNAYFPMMRAVGLFDAKRDAEGIAAVLRAGQKARFEDYSMEEPEAEWSLYLHSYGSSSVMVRQSFFAAQLLPHFAALRSLARLTVYKAEKAEQEGRLREGLALRHAMMQCGVRMREHGTVLGALVGIAIVPIETNRPGGAPLVKTSAELTRDQIVNRRRDLYLAYLHKIGAEDEARWFAQVDATDRQVRTLLETAGSAHPIIDSARPLPAFWTLDMLLLANMLAMLLLCSAAVVCARFPGGEKALPAVVVVLVVLFLLVALPMQWAEGLTQMRVVLDNLSLLSDDTGQKAEGFDISGLITRFPGVVHIGEVLLSLLIPALTLPTLGGVSLVRRETFTAALSRGLRRGGLIFTTLLTVAYAGALIATARAEARAGAVLDGMTHNAVAYLRRQSSP